MVRPGATTRKPREKFLLPGRRTALIVCHAISMAMTVVLPAPVASLRARRSRRGLASRLAASDQAEHAFGPGSFGGYRLGEGAGRDRPVEAPSLG